MKVNEILTRHPACIAEQATLVEAARQMKILDVGLLPVCDEDQHVLGMVTDRDIATRGVAQELDPNTATVGDIMTEDTIWCFEDQDVAEAAKLMVAWQIRRLPVLNRQGRLVGIISMGDLALRTGGNTMAAEVLEQVSAPPLLCESNEMVA